MGAGTSARQHKLARVWIENELNNSGMSFRQMALAAGYANGTASQYGKRQLMKEGTQRAIKEIAATMKDSLVLRGVDQTYLADKIHQMLEGKFAKDVNFRAINYGLEHALKIGIGGGYKPEETRTVNYNVTPEELRKYSPLKDEFEERMREQELSSDDSPPIA